MWGGSLREYDLQHVRAEASPELLEGAVELHEPALNEGDLIPDLHQPLDAD